MNDLPDFSHQGYQLLNEIDQVEPTGWITYLAEIRQETPEKLDQKDDQASHPRDLFAQHRSVVIRQCRLGQAGLADEQIDHYRQRFQILQKLDHPRIPRYLDFFETADGFCCVQQWVKARPCFDNQPLKLAAVKKTTIALLETLVYMQSLTPPVIHQNLCPASILIDDQQQIYLVDFNLLGVQADLTIGQPVTISSSDFTPPELLSQQPLTKATDLYGLGATLFCWLTGTSFQDVDRLLDEQHHFSLTSLPSNLNPTFVGWLKKLVEPNPQDRYPNAEAALAEIVHRSMQRIPPQLQILSRPRVFIPTLVVAGLLLAGGFMTLRWLTPSTSVVPPTEPVATAPPTPPTPTTAAEWLQQGDTFRENNDYDRALQSYQQATTLEPQNQIAWFFQGFCLGQLRRYPEAIAAYDQSLKLDPKDYTAWYNRGWIRIQLPDYPASLKDFEQAIALKPDYQLAWFQKGKVLTALKRYPDALKAYDKAIILDPKDTKSLNNRGLVLTELGKHAEALTAYDKAIEIDERNAIAWNNRGWALYKLGRSGEALTAYNRALAIQPDYELAINNRKLVLQTK